MPTPSISCPAPAGAWWLPDTLRGEGAGPPSRNLVSSSSVLGTKDVSSSSWAHSERIGMRQSQVDKLYAGLKDLSEERRGKLDERFRLFQLNREVDDLEQWIAEREVVAGSHELGQDYEHVTVRTVQPILRLIRIKT